MYSLSSLITGNSRKMRIGIPAPIGIPSFYYLSRFVCSSRNVVSVGHLNSAMTTQTFMSILTTGYLWILRSKWRTFLVFTRFGLTWYFWTLADAFTVYYYFFDTTKNWNEWITEFQLWNICAISIWNSFAEFDWQQQNPNTAGQYYLEQLLPEKQTKDSRMIIETGCLFRFRCSADHLFMHKSWKMPVGGIFLGQRLLGAFVYFSYFSRHCCIYMVV